jgi:hypothetical protein
MKFTPEIITSLEPNEVFVFGSNLRGAHGAGAAKLAVEKFGAIYGEGEGLMGRSYAFPTKDENIKTLSLADIKTSVDNFLVCCKKYPQKTFLITAVGTGLAGYSASQIAPLFKEVALLRNVTLPKEFVICLRKDLDITRSNP